MMIVFLLVLVEMFIDLFLTYVRWFVYSTPYFKSYLSFSCQIQFFIFLLSELDSSLWVSMNINLTRTSMLEQKIN
jgi:hypothetical protein